MLCRSTEYCGVFWRVYIIYVESSYVNKAGSKKVLLQFKSMNNSESMLSKIVRDLALFQFL